MRDTRVASRYAKSLLTLALENGELEQVYKDMLLIYGSCRASRELVLLLKSPIIKPDKKIVLMKRVFGEHISTLSFSFIKIVAKKKRENYLFAITKSFLEQYKEHKNILTTVVTTAVGLDDKLRARVIDVVKESTHSEIELEEHVNTNLIGGMILQVGDKQIDLSVLNQLKKLQRNFSENPYISEL